MDQLNAQIGPDASLLLVDDDEIFVTRLARAMEKRGFQPETSLTVAGAMRLIERRAPAYAVKMGATDYLAKPADANDVTSALLSSGELLPPPPENPMSADRVRWEHIQRVYEQCERNVSETARRLHMHRRTLQRILAKRGPR